VWSGHDAGARISLSFGFAPYFARILLEMLMPWLFQMGFLTFRVER
jgi:hypothetical protein